MWMTLCVGRILTGRKVGWSGKRSNSGVPHEQQKHEKIPNIKISPQTACLCHWPLVTLNCYNTEATVCEGCVLDLRTSRFHPLIRWGIWWRGSENGTKKKSWAHVFKLVNMLYWKSWIKWYCKVEIGFYNYKNRRKVKLNHTKMWLAYSWKQIEGNTLQSQAICTWVNMCLDLHQLQENLLPVGPLLC